MTDPIPVRENLVRALPGASFRATEGSTDGRLGTLYGRLANYGQWAEVNSAVEGHFLERTMPGAFTKTFAENRSRMQVIFDHGQDRSIGRKPLGPLEQVLDTRDGVDYEAALLDTSYNRDLLPGLRANVYGNSYRFSVPRGKDVWDYKPARSDYNPQGLPERTVNEAKIIELGPTPFPIYDGTSTGVRSLTDDYYARVLATRAAPAPPDEPTVEALPERAEAAPHSDDVEPPEVLVPETPVIEVPQENRSVEYITREDKASRVNELKSSISTRAVEFPGVFPDDVQALDDAENAEHDALVRDVEAWDARQARVRAFGETVKHTERAVPNVIRTHTADDIYSPDQISGIGYRSIDERNQTIRDNAMRSLEGFHAPKGSSVDELSYLLDREDGMNERGLPELASRMILTGSPVYRRAFAKYLRSGNSIQWTAEEQRAAALAVVGTTTTGGYAVPYIFDPTIIRVGAYTAQNPYRAACRVETITNGNNWRTVTVGAVTSAYAAEPTAASEGGPTFAQPTYTVQRAQAFATVSIETLQDRPDISAELTTVFAESKATLEENKFTLGAGTTVFPQGMFLDGAYTAQTTATNDVTAILDLQVIEGALPLRFRANGAWFMNRSTLRQFLALDTTYRYFSGAGLQFPGNPNPMQDAGSNGGGNSGYKLLGYPVWEVPSAVSTLTTDAAIIAAFCDPSTYIIVDRIGMNVEVIPNMLNGATPSFPTGERGIYCYWRNTARVLVADGGRQLKVQ